MTLLYRRYTKYAQKNIRNMQLSFPKYIIIFQYPIPVFHNTHKNPFLPSHFALTGFFLIFIEQKPASVSGPQVDYPQQVHGKSITRPVFL